MVDLPLGATEDRVCGTIDIEKALTGREYPVLIVLCRMLPHLFFNAKSDFHRCLLLATLAKEGTKAFEPGLLAKESLISFVTIGGNTYLFTSCFSHMPG
jgi:Mg-chelatase subunit ChlI